MAKEDDLSPYMSAKGMLHLTAKDIVASVAAAVFFVVVARFLPDVSDLGFLTGIQTLIAMFIILSSFGLARSATRFIATLSGSKEHDRASSLYPVIFYISVLTSIVFSLIFLYLAPILSTSLFHDSGYTDLIKLASLDVFLFSLSSSAIFLLYASQKFRDVSVISILNSVIKFPAALALFLLGFGLEGIIVGLIVGDAVTLFMFIRRLLPFLRLSNIKFHGLGGLLRYAMPLYGSMILNFLSSKVDIYLLMLLSSLYAVGIYSPAAFVGNTFFIILAALDQALLPYTSHVFGRSGMTSFKSTSRVMCKYLFLFYFPLGFALIASVPQLIPLILGERFSDSAYSTIIILLAITLTAPGTVFNTLLRSAGYTGVLLKADSMALAAQLVISISMIPILGTIGAAAARSISRFVFFIYPAYYLWRLGGLGYDRNHLLIGIIGSLATGVFIYCISRLFSNLYLLPLIYAGGFFIYLLVLRTSKVLETQDLQFLNRMVPTRMRWLSAFIGKILRK